MQFHPTVLLIADDAALLERATTSLSEQGWDVRTRQDSHTVPDLIVRDWRDDRPLEPTSTRIVTVDLSLCRGETLSEVAERVLGLRASPRFAAAAAVSVLFAEVAEA